MKAEEGRASTTLTASSHLRRYLDGGGASKACASLARIIAVISTVPPSLPRDPRDLEPKTLGGPERGIGIDLNLRLGPLPGTGSGSAEEDGGSVPARSSVADVHSSGDASVVDKKGAAKAETTTEAVSAISPAESAAGEAMTAEKSSVGDYDPTEEATKAEGERGGEAEEGERVNGGEGYLGLLLEAVRQISGECFDGKPGGDEAAAAAAAEEEKEEEGDEEAVAPANRKNSTIGEASGSKRRRTGWAPSPLDFYEDTGPVVRSKRGRNQALPSRYRDTVLEPWAKPPTVHRPGRSARPRTAR